MNLIQQLEAEQISKLTDGKSIPDFAAGDTVRVNVRVVEGSRERLQAYEGVCISRKNRGLNSSFTARQISNGEGGERATRRCEAELAPSPRPSGPVTGHFGPCLPQRRGPFPFRVFTPGFHRVEFRVP